MKYDLIITGKDMFIRTYDDEKNKDIINKENVVVLNSHRIYFVNLSLKKIRKIIKQLDEQQVHFINIIPHEEED